ncbi:MAG: Rne/Rng family ribonuclease [Bacteroidota bacterium]
MSKEIIINADKNQTRIALIEDGELVELHIESTENERTLGDIYLGRVRRTMPSIQAAFIDIGQKQDAFLHYSDLADNLPQWLKLLVHNKPNVSQMAAHTSDLPTSARSRSRRSREDDSKPSSRGRQSRDAKRDSDVVAADADGADAAGNNAKGRRDGKTAGKDGDGKSRDNRGRDGKGRDGKGRGGRDRDNRGGDQKDSADKDADSNDRGGNGRDNKGRDDRGRDNKDLRGKDDRGRGDRDRDDGGRDGRRDSAPVVDKGTDKGSGKDGESKEDGKGRRRPPQRRGDHKEKRSSSRRDSRDSVSKQEGDSGKGGKRSSRSSRRKGGTDGGNGRPPETFLDKGKRILVKIVKEPISNKGSRVSTDISLAGRFLVLVPLANYVAVSKKIYSYKERRRLRALARSLLPTGFGVIVRTVAEGKKAKELDTDLRLLLEKWRKIEKRLEGSPEPPISVHEDVSMASSVIRDLFSDDYDRILIDDTKLYKNVKNYVQAVAPHMVPAVQFHKGKQHIFKASKIAHDVNQAFQSRVDLPSGGYLFIEHTEAMHVVDVNSGRAGRGLSQEQNSLKVDIEAVHAITKQIRLRDLGGIIVIDFIDLREERNRKKVYFELKKAFSRDRAVTKILPMSDFGLVEITRQRLRPSITKRFSEEESTIKKVDGDQSQPQRKERPMRSMTIEGFVEKIERWITTYKKKNKARAVTLKVHPFAEAFLTQRIPSYPTRWFLKYFLRVKLVVDEELDPLGFKFINPKTGEEFVRRSSNNRGRGRGGRRNNAKRSNNKRNNDKATKQRYSAKDKKNKPPNKK